MKMQSQTTLGKLQLSSRREEGFSLIELMCVMVVALIMTLAVVSNLIRPAKSFYAIDMQTTLILDTLREANLQALNNRRGFRVEINYTTRQVKLIDERGVGTNDDVTLRSTLMGSLAEVQMSEAPPSGISISALPSFNNFIKETSAAGQQIVNFRFRSNGTVTKTDGTVASGRLFLWQPRLAREPSSIPTLVRGITIFGPSNGIQLWKYTGGTFING